MKILALLMFASILSCATVNSQKSDCTHSDSSFQCVKFKENYDGDTITFDIPGVPVIIGRNVNVRVRGIDAPELRTKQSCEKSEAYLAKRLVEEKLSQAASIQLRNVARDKYFRILADVYFDDVSLKEVLLAEKLAVPYEGGKKSSWQCAH